MECILCGIGSWCCCIGIIIKKGVKQDQIEIQKARDIKKLELDFNNFVNDMENKEKTNKISPFTVK
jgi:hypothetical protein